MKYSKLILVLIGVLFFVGLLAIATQSPHAALLGSMPLVFGTTLAANKPRSHELGDINSLPVIASDIIYEGAAVGDNGLGYARPLVAGDPFRGFSTDKADNSSGSAGDINVNVKTKGKIQLSVAGVTALTDVGKLVFASDDDTFTLTAGSNSQIGVISRWVSGTNCIVDYDTSSTVSEAVTLSEMADLARGSIISGQTANNRPTALNAKADGQILIGDGTDLNSVAVSGDVTITNAGVTTIGAKKVTAGMTAIANGKILVGGAGGAGAEKTPSGVVSMTNEGVFSLTSAGSPLANTIADPGNGQAIPVTASGVCAITTAGAETNTLAAPSAIGMLLVLTCDVYVGDRVVTCATTVNQTGNNTLTFGAAGDTIILYSTQIGGALRWRIAGNDGVGLSTV